MKSSRPFARRRRRRIAIGVLLTASLLLLLLPVAWVILMSLRPLNVIVRGLDSVLSTQFTLEHYVALFTQYNVLRFIANSLVGALVPAVISVSVGLLAAYAIVRFRFRWSATFQSLPLFAQVLPAILLIVPMYEFMLFLRVVNTYVAIVLAHTALVLPFSIWMLTGYIRSLPAELEEAAMVDGCSRLGAIVRVVIPVASGGIVATASIAFIMAWSEFLFAFVLLSGDQMRNMAVAVYLFVPSSNAVSNFGLLFAASTVFMLPSLLFFPLVQRWIGRDATAGSIQGF